MAIKSALCNSFKLELLQGVHGPGDVYKIALYTNLASLGHGTTTYSPKDEVSGQGYIAGGVEMKGYRAGLEGNTAFITWSEDPLWPVVSVTARGCLIYNASKENRAVAVFDFGNDYTAINGSFVAALPPAGRDALVRVT